MFEIRVSRRFNALHALLISEGVYEPLHGHDWVVTVSVRSKSLDQIDTVMDFHELERMLDNLLLPLQGGNLNHSELLSGVNTSAERLAERLAHRLAPLLPEPTRLKKVTVTESPGCDASYILG